MFSLLLKLAARPKPDAGNESPVKVLDLGDDDREESDAQHDIGNPRMRTGRTVRPATGIRRIWNRS